MNKSYRSVFNETLGTWVAVSELSAARGKRSSSTRLAATVLATLGLGAALPVFAADECGKASASGIVNCSASSYPRGAHYNGNNLSVNINGTTQLGDAGGFVHSVHNTGNGSGTNTTTTNGDVRVVSGTSGLETSNSGTGNAVTQTSEETNITVNGTTGAYGISAEVSGTGDATATNRGTIRTTGAGTNNHGVFAQSASGNAAASNSGTLNTAGQSSDGINATATNAGNAVATNSGSVTTNGSSARGVVAYLAKHSAAQSGSATANNEAGGTIDTNGAMNAKGLLADAIGTGNATVTNAGRITTRGTEAEGVIARVHSAGTATANNTGTVETAGSGSQGVLASVESNGTGNADAFNSGNITTTGGDAAALIAQITTASSQGNATATMTANTVRTSGNGSTGVVAITAGLGNATASVTGGRIDTKGNSAAGVSANITNANSMATASASVSGTNTAINTEGQSAHGVEAINSGSGRTEANMTGGTIRTSNTVAFGVIAQTTGLGEASATVTNGAIETQGVSGTGIAANVVNAASTANASVSMSGADSTISTAGDNANGLQASNTGSGAAQASMNGGTIRTSGADATGILAIASGLGSATATVTDGTVTTQGANSSGVSAYVNDTNSAANASVSVSGANTAITTTGDEAYGVHASNSGAGLAQISLADGAVSASGNNADGLKAESTGGSVIVDVNSGSVIGGSGDAAAIRTLAANGSTVNIAAEATVNGSASGIAIRDGDATYSGTDAIGGDTTVNTAGTVTGSAILGTGNDSLNLTGGSFSGDIYGDDQTASANDGDDQFTWSDGSFTGGFYGQNGSDTVVVTASNYNGSNVLDGGDDASAADGMVDRLTLRDITASAGGAQLLNWERIDLENAKLTLSGAPLTVGNGPDAQGGTLGLNISADSTVLMGSNTFNITGDVRNSGMIYLRRANGMAGNLLTINGNYTGQNGVVALNTVLGGDASATDKLVIGGNTSGTTRLLVNNVGGAGAATVNGIQVVQVKGTSSANNFTLAKPVQTDAYEYLLQRGGKTDGDANSFYLNSRYQGPVEPPAEPAVEQPREQLTPVATGPAPAAPEVLRPAVPGYLLGAAATNELGQSLMGSLHQREGEQQTLQWDQREGGEPAPKDQVWGRVGGQRLTQNGQQQFGSQQNLFFAEFGKDLSIRYSDIAGDKARTHTGFSAGYGQTSVDFSDRRRGDAGLGYDTGKMDGQMLKLSAYQTRYADNGGYFDLVGQLHAVRNEYRDKYDGEATQTGYGGGVSAEVGRPWQIGASQWQVEPQGQLSYLATRYKGFQDAVSSVEGQTSQSLRARVGVRLAWNGQAQRADARMRSNTFYLTANVIHEFKDQMSVTVGSTKIAEQWAKPTWAEVGFGGQTPIAKNTYLYGSAQYQQSISGNSRKGGAAQIGVRAEW